MFDVQVCFVVLLNVHHYTQNKKNWDITNFALDWLLLFHFIQMCCLCNDTHFLRHSEFSICLFCNEILNIFLFFSLFFSSFILSNYDIIHFATRTMGAELLISRKSDKLYNVYVTDDESVWALNSSCMVCFYHYSCFLLTFILNGVYINKIRMRAATWGRLNRLLLVNVLFWRVLCLHVIIFVFGYIHREKRTNKLNTRYSLLLLMMYANCYQRIRAARTKPLVH